MDMAYASTGSPEARNGAPLARRRGDRTEAAVSHTPVTRALGLISIGLGVAKVLAPRELATLAGVRNREALFRVAGALDVVSGVGILGRRKPAAWAWARLGGDVLDLALLGGVLTTDRRSARSFAAATAVAGLALLDYVGGRQLQREEPIDVERSVTIGRPADELASLWRDAQALARIFAPFAEVSDAGQGRLRWKVMVTKRRAFEWTTELAPGGSGEALRWASTQGAPLRAEGSLVLRPAPHEDLGTEVTLRLRFEAPPGPVAGAVAKVLRGIPETLSRTVLRRFKSLAETGEIPTLKHNPSARKGADAEERA